MKEKVRIPVEIKLVRDPDGKTKLKATIPINFVLDKNFDAKWFEEELLKFERRYFYLITCLKSILETLHSKKQKEGRVLLYWEIGEKIINFLKNSENKAFYIENFTKSLIRDVGISEKIFSRCKRFRVHYPDVAKINPMKSFDSYVATFEKGYLSRKRAKRDEIYKRN